MGDHGDDMFDDDLRNESCIVCPIHGILYLPRHPCPKCEDGGPPEPFVLTDEDGEPLDPK